LKQNGLRTVKQSEMSSVVCLISRWSEPSGRQMA